MEYNVYGTVSFVVDFDIEANSEEQAIELMKQLIHDEAQLRHLSFVLDEDKIKLDLNAIEIEYDED